MPFNGACRRTKQGVQLKNLGLPKGALFRAVAKKLGFPKSAGSPDKERLSTAHTLQAVSKSARLFGGATLLLSSKREKALLLARNREGRGSGERGAGSGERGWFAHGTSLGLPRLRTPCCVLRDTAKTSPPRVVQGWVGLEWM